MVVCFTAEAQVVEQAVSPFCPISCFGVKNEHDTKEIVVFDVTSPV